MVDPLHGVEVADQPAQVDEDVLQFDLVKHLLRPAQEVLSHQTQSVGPLDTVMVLGHDLTVQHKNLVNINTQQYNIRLKSS